MAVETLCCMPQGWRLWCGQLLLNFEFLEIQNHAVGSFHRIERKFKAAPTVGKERKSGRLLLFLVSSHEGLLHSAEVVASILHFEQDGSAISTVLGEANVNL